MGRVYNALVKAERLSSVDRPIGYTPRPLRAKPALPTNERSLSASPDPQSAIRDPRSLDSPGRDFRASSGPAPPDFSCNRSESVPEAPIVKEEFDFGVAVALNDAAAASQRRQAPVAHTLPVGPALPVPEVFVEPRTVLNVRDLRIAPHLAALLGDDSLACERYRSLGVGLLNLGTSRKLKTILVTSSEEGEGKSTIASNVAWSIAKPSGRRVLLLDANPDSSSSVSRLFGMNTLRGWIGAAEGRCQLADAAVRLNPNGLYVLMQGSIEAARDSAASDALTSPAFEKLIARLERDFDFIVIDSPSILESYGAQRLASLADGTVFVVRAARTPHNAVTDGLRLVPRDRQLGLVLNESEIKDENTYGRNKKKTGRHYLGSR